MKRIKYFPYLVSAPQSFKSGGGDNVGSGCTNSFLPSTSSLAWRTFGLGFFLGFVFFNIIKYFKIDLQKDFHLLIPF